MNRIFGREAAQMVLVAAVTAAALAACGTNTIPADTSPAAPTTSATTPSGKSSASASTTSSAEATGMTQDQAVQLIRQHLEAVGRGDADAWAAALDPDVRFDIGGSIYQGSEAARGWAERDPIGQGGRYDILSLAPTMAGVTADVTFRAGSLVEQIRYQYTIRGGKIVDLIARYRQ